jgi:hypothetical protein
MIPVIAATLLGGYIIFALARHRKKPKMKEERLTLGLVSSNLDAENVMTDTPKTSNQTNAEMAASSPQQPQAAKPVELLRLLRTPQSSQLIVEIGGQRYTKLADITDKKIGQFILQLTAHLLVFTNGVIVTDAGLKSVYKPKVGQVPGPIVTPPPNLQPASSISATRQTGQTHASATSPVPKASPEVEEAFLASLRTSPSQQPQKRGLFGRSKPESIPQPGPGLNLVEEINDIAQIRLRYSPMVATTRIEITGDPDGGIRIQVNDQFYTNPDDIPDQDVRDLIKASIKEWERR